MVCVRPEEWLEVHMTLVGPVRRRKATNGGNGPRPPGGPERPSRQGQGRAMRNVRKLRLRWYRRRDGPARCDRLLRLIHPYGVNLPNVGTLRPPPASERLPLPTSKDS
jgi:hypothetical protein